ncbi:helix-turn-helix transcriptional regulator [Lactobacillus sp. YT155]|uniref:helix-turn-helix domain-containing protein n=1 Tax=Lactobacillus sp. YT155 TaxID=3060955 RepID=UPI0026602E5F|nr:helix-turn-helix transcriptional regulator [Lactobacillus sp. YT155]MDO1605322.1 helix-turn-helix transcriptional regulator [Lactobacillus sp. YT155]
MKNDGQLIADHLITLINERNITINRLAVLSGINQSTLNALYDGSSKRPTITTIRAICSGLGISVQEFFDFPPYNEVEKN